MKISEVIQQVDLSRRAVKYYEEQGLITVRKDENGYRNYTKENLADLKEIAAYRKLGISISDIRKLLHTDNPELLKNIYKKKVICIMPEKKNWKHFILLLKPMTLTSCTNLWITLRSGRLFRI